MTRIFFVILNGVKDLGWDRDRPLARILHDGRGCGFETLCGTDVGWRGGQRRKNPPFPHEHDRLSEESGGTEGRFTQTVDDAFKERPQRIAGG